MSHERELFTWTGCSQTERSGEVMQSSGGAGGPGALPPRGFPHCPCECAFAHYRRGAKS
jgi:hypothetical protein